MSHQGRSRERDTEAELNVTSARCDIWVDDGGGGGGCGEAFLLVLFFLPVRASSTAIFHDVISIVSWSIMLRTIGSILLGVGGWGGV